MKLIKPSFEILEQEPGLQGIYKAIERAGRTCYKSEAFITDDSAEKFVKMIIDRGHTAMLEHGTAYLHICNGEYSNIEKYLSNPYSIVTERLYGTYDPNCSGEDFDAYITTNYRVLYENNWLDDLKYLCEPTGYHEKRISVKFMCDIGVSREYNRHRVNSVAESSTRYCNFSKDKFNNEITSITPCWLSREEVEKLEVKSLSSYCENITMGTYTQWGAIDYWLFSLVASEFNYMNLIRLGWAPQQARSVLTLATKTELVHTALISDWKHFLKLRCAKDAHPQAQELAIPLQEKFKELNYI